MHEQGKNRPGPIENSDLADDKDSKQLKGDIQEHLTHEWISEDKWKLLYRWYGGGPIFDRKVFEKGNNYMKEKYICQHPRFIKFIFCNETGQIPNINDDNTEIHGYPKDYTLQQIALEFEKKYGFIDEKTEDDTTEPFVHLWIAIKEVIDIYVSSSRNVDVKKKDQIEKTNRK